MTPEKNPLVSVVTPVYNGERYIRECVESILAQTYTDWDYTVVNNCSSDRTVEIVQEYSARDPRIRIVNNEKFVRAIENHNIAFRQISPESKYCKVVAADDWLFPECLEKMVALAEAHPLVAIVGAYGLEGNRVIYNGLSYPGTVVPGRDLCRRSLLGELYVFGAPTSVLFRSDIVRSRRPFYNEDNLHADGEACYEILEHHDFGFVHQVLTCLRLQQGSLTSQSGRLNTYLPNDLRMLVRFGRKYLDEAERSAMIRGHLKKYYAFLGRQVFEHRDEQFWGYHRGKLAVEGYPLNRSRLMASAALHFLDVFFSRRMPAMVLRRMGRVWARLTGREDVR